MYHPERGEWVMRLGLGMGDRRPAPKGNEEWE